MEATKSLKTHAEYKIALKRTIALFNAEPGTPEATELDTLLPLIVAYEDKHYQMPVLEAVGIIKP